MLPFDLLPTEGSSIPPRWDGQHFVVGDQLTPVLEYRANALGWSDELSALHEEALGDAHPLDVASRYDALQQVKKYIPSAQSVIMEIGCSSGYFIRDLAQFFPEVMIIGGDIVKEPLYQLARRLPGIPLIRFDILQCPLPAESVDVLVMINVLEHIENDAAALQKSFNLLKPGGTLIIEVPASPVLYDAYDAQLNHFRRYKAQELHKKLMAAGFKIRRKSHLGFILFPAFAAVKLWKKWFSSSRNKSVVRQQAMSTMNNPMVKWAMAFESKYLSNLSLPFGIRVLAVAVKD